MQLGNTVHFNSFKWVKEELRQLLLNVQRQLESYVNNPEDIAKLDNIISSMRQVRGTLSLVEIYGAALLSEEMELVARALKSDEIPSRDNAYEVLLNAAIKLPDYLESLTVVGNKDVPMVLLPLLNDLRACRNASLLSENVLFFPDISAATGTFGVKAVSEGNEPVQDSATLATKLRHSYQLGLLGWFRNQKLEESYGRMHAVIKKLHAAANHDNTSRLWWVASAIVEALQKDAVEPSVALKSLMGKVDRQIKQLADLSEEKFQEHLPQELTKNLLYYVACSEPATDTINEIKTKFNLSKYLPSESDLLDAEKLMGGPNQDLLNKVSEAIQEDINQAKDIIEIFMHGDRNNFERIKPVLGLYAKISDTLGMLGMGRGRETILAQKETLESKISANEALDEETLMSAAGTLLTIENELEDYVTNRANYAQVSGDPEAADAKPTIENQHVVTSLINESLKDIILVKDAFLNFIETPEDLETITLVPNVLKELSGAMFVKPLEQVVPVITQLKEYFEFTLIESKHKPVARELDVVADIVTYIECFLEAIAENRADGNLYISAAKESLDALQIVVAESDMGLATIEDADESPTFSKEGLLDVDGHAEDIPLPNEENVMGSDELVIDESELDVVDPLDIQQTAEDAVDDAVELVQPVEPVVKKSKDEKYQDLQVIGEDADEEIIDVFIEEAMEEYGRVREFFPLWQQSAENQEAITTMRRSFHTLKGSGRLIGATVIGEFSWAIENMFNKLIDGTITESPAMYSVVEEALEVLPVLIDQIRGAEASAPQIYNIMEKADKIAAGQPLSDSEGIGAAKVQLIDDAPVNIVNDDAQITTDSEPLVASDDEVSLASQNDSQAVNDEIPVIDDGSPPSHDDEVPAIGEIDAPIVASNEVSGSEASNDFIVTEAADEENKSEITNLNPIDLSDIEDEEPSLTESVESLENDDEQLLDSELEEVEAIDIEDAIEDVAEPIEHSIVDNDEWQEGSDLTAKYLQTMIDPTLLDIFSDEAQTHLEEIERISNKAKLSALSSSNVEALIRALHTLNGSARTAKFFTIAEKADLLEQHANNLAELGQSWNMQELELLDRSTRYFNTCIAHLREHTTELIDESDLQQRLADCLSRSERELSAKREQESSYSSGDSNAEFEEVDEELIEIFLEEVPEIVNIIERELQEWKQDKKSDRITEVMRQLHTLKGSARMAGLADIGDLSHAFESLLVSVASDQIEVNSALEDALIEVVDLLDGMLDELKQGKIPSVPGEYIKQLENLRTGSVAETVDKLVEEDSSQSNNSDISVTTAAEPEPAEITAFQSEESPASLPTAVESSEVEEVAEVIELEIGDAPEVMPTMVQQHEQIRVRSDKLDMLVNNAGEVNIYHSRLGQYMNDLYFNLGELEQTVQRLHRQLRDMEIQTEAQIASRIEREAENPDEDFDPLEMDRYSHMQQLSRALSESASDLDNIKDTLDDIVRNSEVVLQQQSRVSTELQEELLQTRMIKFEGLASRLRRIVRQTATQLGKKVDLKIIGANNEIDRSVQERMLAPLEHMLRNAVYHGIEMPEQRLASNKPENGNIRLEIARDGSYIILNVIDDGAGIDATKVKQKAIELGLIGEDEDKNDHDIIQYILHEGFSTVDNVSQIAGRGVGMDVVDSEIKQLGGSLSITSQLGRGSSFSIRLPLTLAINQALLIQLSDDIYAIPASSIEGIALLTAEEIQENLVGSRKSYEYAGINYDMYYLGALLGFGAPSNLPKEVRYPLLLIRSAERQIGVHVDMMIGRREIVVKPVGPQITAVPGISGATILADGRVALILDVANLISTYTSDISMQSLHDAAVEAEAENEKVTVMVVDDSITIRKVTARILARNNLEVITAKDGLDAVQQLQEVTPDLFLMDIEMPRMDGFELATHVRSDSRLQGIPIIMITSRTGDKHRERAQKIGVNKYLGKPFQEGELMSEINELLEKAVSA